jgi:TP901 family phage tail tape measure protein
MPARTIASLAVEIGVDLSDFDKNMKEFKKTWGGVGKQMQEVGTQVGTTFTAAGGAIAAGLGFAVKTASEFDSQMSRVGAIAGASGDDLNALRQSALDLGASTSKSASEVAKGMELMASKGYTAQQIISAMPGVIAASEASGEDMALVADTVASAMNAFGLSAEKATTVADVLSKSANQSAAGVTDLQYAFKYAAPVASSLGISMETLAAATGIMADSGMKGEQAGTTLRAALLRLTDPPKEAAAKLKELGVSVTDASGKFLPFDQIISQLSSSTANMTDAQKAQALSTIFGTEAMTGMLSLVTAGPEKLNQLTTGLNNAGGSASETAKKMKDNLGGSMEQLSGAFETLQISLGTALAPAIKTVADGLAGLVNWFNNLSEPTKNFIAIGAALTAILFLVIGAVGFLTAALGFLAAAQWAAIAPIAGFIAIAVAAIAIVAVLAFVIIKYWDEIKAATMAVWESIKSAIMSAWEFIVNIFATAWSVVAPIFNAFWNGITAIWTTAFDVISTLLTAWWDIIKTIFATAFLAIYYLVTGQWDEIGGVFKAAWDKIKDIVTNLFGDLWDIFTKAFNNLLWISGKLWDDIKDAFVTGWNNVKNWFSNMVSDATELGRNIIRGMVDGIASMGSMLMDKAKEVVKGAVDAAKSFLGINSPSKLFMELGGFTGEGFAIGLENTSSDVANSAGIMASAPLDVVNGLSTPNVNAKVGTSSQTVVIELDGRTIAKSTFANMGGTIRMRGAVT